ncbi:RraA family protein [Pseudonocardia sp. TRM90224]|uniref:RraA family protein n=1 Tax=Pseudonocardia sp. TRM90224 TaxID=2812678 RepID=UPI001E5C9B71|nr:RraA family protein [Pseudonocardia sp. TRM90224]
MIDRSAVRERFLAVDTSNVADVLDERGLPHQGLHPDLRPFSGERLAGWAYTIAGGNAAYEGGGDPTKMQACGGIGPDEVSVWSGGGEGVCYFGELIALGMAERGSVGALVDAGVRDVRWLDEHGFPVFARYRTPIQSIGRWRVTGWQEPVPMPGATTPTVQVRPGDFVLADHDGVLVVPAEHVLPVLERAEELTATEVRIRAALREGSSLADVLDRFGHV